MSNEDDSLLQTQTRDGVVHVRFRHARIEGAFSPQIERELRAVADGGQPARVLVHFDNITYMPTVALGAMISFNKRVKQSGGEVHLVGLQPPVRELFKISALDRVFPIHADAASARAEMD